MKSIKLKLVSSDGLSLRKDVSLMCNLDNVEKKLVEIKRRPGKINELFGSEIDL